MTSLRKFGEVDSGRPPVIAAADNVGNIGFLFDRFEVFPTARTLLRDGSPLAIGSRAFDLLLVLLRSSGTIVSNETILNRVWPSTIVSEGNLRFQVTVLRKVLGTERDLIKNIPGRGYLFTAEVSVTSANRKRLAPPTDIGLTLNQTASCKPYLTGAFEEKAATSKELSVVVIDDDADTREALQSLLRSAGVQVETFPSIQAFLDAPELRTPKCLLLDVWLPGQTGMDFQAALAKTAHSPHVILMSGHADVSMSVRAMKAGAWDFLTKPVRHEELLDTIQRALAV